MTLADSILGKDVTTNLQNNHKLHQLPGVSLSMRRLPGVRPTSRWTSCGLATCTSWVISANFITCCHHHKHTTANYCSCSIRCISTLKKQLFILFNTNCFVRHPWIGLCVSVLGKIIVVMISNQNWNHQWHFDFKIKNHFQSYQKLIWNQNHLKMILNH